MISASVNAPLSFENILKFFQQTKFRLPYHEVDGVKLYLIPSIVIKINTTVRVLLGFTYITESDKDTVTINGDVVVSGSTIEIGQTQDITMTLAFGSSTDTKQVDVTNITVTKPGDGNDDGKIDTNETVTNEIDKFTGYITSSTPFVTKQIGYGQFIGCACVFSGATITIGGVVVDEYNANKPAPAYALNARGQLETSTAISSTDSFFNTMAELMGFEPQTGTKAILTNIQKFLYAKTGFVSPYINVGSLNYMLVESNDFDQNDFGWEAMYNTYYKNNVDQAVYPNNADLINDMFRYNMAMLNNKQNEEFAPTLRNPDYISIHTFRHEHGVVDFYFPLNFLFICQGISSGFPHYACASQSLVVKFTFLNPKAFINTCIVVKPTAIDPLDTTMQARVYINRINTHQLFTTNSSDMRMILFYNRYVWIPELTDIITNYNKYVWVIKNYERIYRDIGGQVNGQTVLYEFGRSVFYTKIWMFIINTDTYNVIQSQGGLSQVQPLYVNKYHLPIFDVCSFQESNAYNTANSMTGTGISNWNKQYNSPYGLVPVDSFQLTTNSTIGMQDNLPYRLQQFSDYVMLNHTQPHQTITNNNLVQFNIDPIFYQEGTPNSTYAPAYAPTFYVKYNPKMNTGYNKKYGCILISECMNISYISNHVMLSKYQTDN